MMLEHSLWITSQTETRQTMISIGMLFGVDADGNTQFIERTWLDQEIPFLSD